MKRRYGQLTAVLLAASLLLSGCGKSHNSDSFDGMYAKSASYESNDMFESAAVYQSDAAGSANASAGCEAIEAADLDYDAGGTDEETMDQTVTGQAEKSVEKLIYTCSVEMQTLEYEAAVSDIKDKIEVYKGFVEYEYESDSNRQWYKNSDAGTRYLSMTIRIPTSDYRNFLDSLSGTGKVISRTANVENISSRYHDTEVIIENLVKQETRLSEMMDSAKTIKDMISIEERLTEVQTQLDSYRTELSRMDSDVAYSTINLTLEEVRKYEERTVTPITFGERIVQAVKGSISDFTDFLQNVLIELIYALPSLILLVIIVLVILRLTRRKRAEFKARMTERRAKKAEKKHRDPEDPAEIGQEIPAGNEVSKKE